MGQFGGSSIESNKAREKGDAYKVRETEALVLAFGQTIRNVAHRRGKTSYIESIKETSDSGAADIVTVSSGIVGNAAPMDNRFLCRMKGARRDEIAKGGVSSYIGFYRG